jgi:hypothetical protein
MDLLNRSVRLVEELLEGGIVQRDFRDEFVTYWGYRVHSQGENLFSLVAPEPPSRVVRVWRGEGLEVAGEDQDAIAKWVYHRFGDKTPVKTEARAARIGLQQSAVHGGRAAVASIAPRPGPVPAD